MKIVISIIILGSLAFLIKKFSAKKPAKEISDKKISAETTEAANALKNVTDNGSSHVADEAGKKNTTQLDTDKASLAALQNDAGYKDVLKRIGILQAQNKWGVKDEGGFYYSVDNAGVLFSGGNSTDEYNSMLQQQTDYNTKVAALTKSIANEEGSAAQPNKAVDETTGAASSLEIPLEIKLMISAIKSKFSLDNANEEKDNPDEQKDTDSDEAENNNNNYNGSNNGGNNDNGGGGGGSNNNNPYQFPNTVLPSSVIPTGATLANILSLPITKGVLPFKGNILPFNITPTPTPVINSNPIIANTQVSNQRQAQPKNQRHSGHYYHKQRRTH